MIFAAASEILFFLNLSLNLNLTRRGYRGSSSVVEHYLAKVGVAGSSPVSRFKIFSGLKWVFFSGKPPALPPTRFPVKTL